MSLYINPRHQKDIFLNENITEPNQGYFIKNHTAEMVEEQKRINESLHQSIQGLKSLYMEQENRQSSKWQDLSEQLEELFLWNEKQETIENQVLDRIKKLDYDNEHVKNLLKESQLADQRLSENLGDVTKLQQSIEERLKNYDELQKELQEEIKHQIKTNNKVLEKVTEQEGYQEGIIKRLDKQEALTEKITRQMEYLRTVIFERTSYLSDKIDDVSSYMMKLVSGDPIQSTIMLKEKEKSHK